MAKYAISTLAAHTRYNQWVNRTGLKARARSVLVQGGAGVNVLVPHGGASHAPSGISTPLSKDDAEFLLNHKLFKEHMERGFVKIIDTDRNADAVAKSMSTDEGSRPRDAADVQKFASGHGLGKDDPATKFQAVSNSKKKVA